MVIHWLPLLGALDETWDKLVTRPRHIDLWDTAQLQHPPTGLKPGEITAVNSPEYKMLQNSDWNRENQMSLQTKSSQRLHIAMGFFYLDKDVDKYFTSLWTHISPVFFVKTTYVAQNITKPSSFGFRFSFHCDSVKTFTSWRNQPLDVTKFGTLRILDPPMEGFEPRRGRVLKIATSWWFQPIWKILIKMGIFPK